MLSEEDKVQIVIDAKNQAQPAVAEAQAQLDLLKRALENFTRAELDGTAASIAYREALKIVRDGAISAGLSQEEMRVAVNQARDAMLLFNAAIAGGVAPEVAMAAAIESMNLALNRQKDAVNETKRKWTEFAGLNVIGGLLGAGLGAAGQRLLSDLNPFSNGGMKLLVDSMAAIIPTIVLFGSVLAAATVIVTAFGTAAVGTAAILGSMALGFAGLGAGILLLVDKTGTASAAFQRFKTDATNLADALGKMAAPEAKQILGFLEGLMPLAKSEGEAILSWFGARLPNALTGTRVVLRDLLPDLNQFGSFLGKVFDQLSPQIGPMFEEFARLGIGAVQGLITNLVALEQWFQQRLPSYGPVVGQIFSGIGTAVQFVATQFGHLSDWFVSQWPNIQKNFDAFISGFADGFSKMNAAFGGPGSVDWTGFFNTLGQVVGGAAGVIGDAFRVLGIVFSQVVAALPVALQTIGDNWANFVYNVINDINGLINAFDSLPGFLRGGNAYITPINNINPPGSALNISSAGDTSSNRSRKPTNVTIHVNGAQNPQATAKAVSATLRKVTQF